MNEHQEIIRFWCDRYKERVGYAYPFNGGKDGRIIKDLRGMYSDDQLRTFIAAFFEMEDDFIAGAGYSIGVFRGCLPKVIAYVARGQQPQVPKSVAGVYEWTKRRAAGHE